MRGKVKEAGAEEEVAMGDRFETEEVGWGTDGG